MRPHSSYPALTTLRPHQLIREQHAAMRRSGSFPDAGPSSEDPSATLDLLREMIATIANAMIFAQADQVGGAGFGERNHDRTNRRNGCGRGSGTLAPAPSR